MSRSVAPVAEAFGFTGVPVQLDLRDGSVSVTVVVDQEESSRRESVGLGPITDRGVITALWELPHRIEVAVSDVPTWVLERITAQAPAAVEFQGSVCTRTATAPTTVTGAIAAGRTPSRLLERVGQLSAVCPMAIALPQQVARDEPAFLEAALYGVGVARATAADIEVMSPAEPVSPTPGPFRWWIAERAYEVVLAARAHALS